jgi:hypothetical protein
MVRVSGGLRLSSSASHASCASPMFALGSLTLSMTMKCTPL